MRGLSKSILALATLTAAAAGSRVQADEAYVCEGGRVAYVRFGTLEEMKRKDSCVGAYYGIEAAAAEGGGASAGPDRGSIAAEARVHVTNGAAARPVVAAGPVTPLLRQPPRPVTPHQRADAAARKAAVGAVGRVAARVPPPPPIAHPDTDFRNVRILNPAPGESAIFRHAR